MKFMSDELFDGRQLRIFTLMDNLTRESLAIEVNGDIGARKDIRTTDADREI